MSQKPQGTRFHVEGDERYMEVPVIDHRRAGRWKLWGNIAFAVYLPTSVIGLCGLIQHATNALESHLLPLVISSGVAASFAWVVFFISHFMNRVSSSLRIYTDELQWWHEGSLKVAIPLSQVSKFSFDRNHLWRIETVEGTEFPFMIQGGSLADCSAALRLLAPHAWPQGRGRRLWSDSHLRVGKNLLWIGAIGFFISLALPGPAKTLSFVFVIIAFTGFLSLYQHSDYRRELHSGSNRPGSSAEDILRVWPILDAENRVYGYSRIDVYKRKLAALTIACWTFRLATLAVAIFIGPGFSFIQRFLDDLGFAGYLAMASVILFLLIIWGLTEATRFQLNRITKRSQVRLRLQGRQLFIETEGELLPATLEPQTLGMMSDPKGLLTAVRTLSAGGRKFVLMTDLMVEEAAEESVAQEGVVSEDDDAKDVSELRAT